MACLLVALGIAFGAAVAVYLIMTNLVGLPEGPSALAAGIVGNLFPNIHNYIKYYFSRKTINYNQFNFFQSYFLSWSTAAVYSICLMLGIYSLLSLANIILIFWDISSDTPKFPKYIIDLISFGMFFIFLTAYATVAWWIGRRSREDSTFGFLAIIIIMSIASEYIEQLFYLPGQYFIIFDRSSDAIFLDFLRNEYFFYAPFIIIFVMPFYVAGQHTKRLAFLAFVNRRVSKSTRRIIAQLVDEEAKSVGAPLPLLPPTPIWPSPWWWIAAATGILAVVLVPLLGDHPPDFAMFVAINIGCYFFAGIGTLLTTGTPRNWKSITPKCVPDHPSYGSKPLVWLSISCLVFTLAYVMTAFQVGEEEFWVQDYPTLKSNFIISTMAILASLMFGASIWACLRHSPIFIPLTLFGMFSMLTHFASISFIAFSLLIFTHYPNITIFEALVSASLILIIFLLILYIRRSRRVAVTLLHRVRPDDPLLSATEGSECLQQSSEWLIARQFALLPKESQRVIIELLLEEVNKN
jgi:hypothetical protein